MKLNQINTNLTAKRFLLFFVLLLLGVVALFSLRSSNNFLKYANRELYKPLNENNKGLIGKINYYLANALLKSNNSSNVLIKYPQLIISTSVNDSLATFKDTRLIGYIPSSSEEKDFFYNSQFSKLIKAQNEDLSEEYFIITYSNDRQSIESIIVDSAKLYTSLNNNAWKGTLIFKDPTLQWDSSRKFLVCEKSIIPLFTVTNNIPGQSAIVIGETDYLLPENILKSFYEDAHPLSITVENKLSFTIQQDNVLIVVTTYDSLTSIIVDGKQCGHRKVFLKNLNNKNLYFSLQRRNISVPVTITEKSPYELVSQVANGGYAGNRIDINKNYSDLFSAQILKTLNEQITDKDTASTYRLTYDALQAKYYEDIFRNILVPSFQKRFGKDANTSYEINLTLIDLATGSIVAAPFFNSSFSDRKIEDLLSKNNYNLSSSYEIGSTFKPIITGAAVLNYPSLLDYQFRDGLTYNAVNTQEKIYRVDGFDIKWRVKDPGQYFFPCNSMEEFLATSHDGYPIGIILNGFVGRRDLPAFNDLLQNNYPANIREAIRNNPQFFRYDSSSHELFIRDIGNSYLAKTLSYVFGIPTTIKADENNYFPGINSIHPYQLVPQPSSLFGMESNQFERQTEYSFDGEIRSRVLGQGGIDISLIDLCKAYARLVSGKNITLHYTLPSAKYKSIYLDRDLSNYVAFGNNINAGEKVDVWETFLERWAAAQNNPSSRSTIALGNATFNRARQSFPENLRGESLQVYFKTGTPQNLADTFFFKNVVRQNRGLVLGKDDACFVMVVTNPLANFRNENVKGIVLGVHIGRRKILHDTESKAFEDYDGLQGKDLIESFLTEQVIRNIIRFNKNRF